MDRDCDKDKKGFSSLSDLVSEVSGVDEIVGSKPESEAKACPSNQVSPSAMNTGLPIKPNRKVVTSPPLLSGEAPWFWKVPWLNLKWIFGIIAAVFVIALIKNVMENNKKPSFNTPSPVPKSYKSQKSPSTLAQEIENGKKRAKQGNDFSQGMRHLKTYQQWISFEIKNPMVGFFIASRAATEDKKNNVSLAFTFMVLPDYHCKESMEVIFDVRSELSDDLNREGLIEIQVDNLLPFHLSGEVTASAGNHFVFFQIKNPNFVEKLSNGKQISINVKGIGRANFSLAGFAEAWEVAKDACSVFEFDDSNK